MDNGNQPATKADLAALEDAETRLLKAFYTFAESN
jgi:hypothetical protein